MADHAGRTRQQQRHAAARRRQHGPGETGRLPAVLARIAIGADLARILHRRAGFARGQPVDLDHSLVVAAADRGGGGQAGGVEIAHAARAPDAELAIAFRIAVAQGDGVQIVPDAQQLRSVAATHELDQRGIGAVGRRFDADVALVDFDGAEQQLSVGGPGDGAVAAAADRRIGSPHFERRRAMRLQRDAQVTWIVVMRRCVAETEHRQHVVAGQQRGGRFGVHVVHFQPRVRGRDGQRGHRPTHGLPSCSVSPPKFSPTCRLRRSQPPNARGASCRALNA